jgi:mRNA interferase MazF
MREGDVVIAQVQQADQQRKNRPAVVLRKLPFQDDLLVCGISSRLHLRIPGFDEMISPADALTGSRRETSGSPAENKGPCDEHLRCSRAT